MKGLLVVVILLIAGCSNDIYIRAPSEPVVKISENHIEQLRISGKPVPVKMVPPLFPIEAMRQKITDGYVKLMYDVNRNGQVKNILVAESKPPKVFDESAIKALKGSLYEKSEDGFESVEYIYRFKLKL